MSASASNIRVEVVDSRQRRRDFLSVPTLVFRDDPAWSAPLLAERRDHISKSNPFFLHGEGELFVAYLDSRPVGRISAQIDHLHLERYQDATGFFGMLDAIDDGRVFQALLRRAEGWLLERDMRRIRGPFSFSINDEMGLLVDGFEHPPKFLMGHALPYYEHRLEQLGFVKSRDVFGYLLDSHFEQPRVMRLATKRALRKAKIRPLRRKKMSEELEILRSIFNEAWQDNWSFVPFTKAEFDKLGAALKYLIPEDFVLIAEIDGEPAAMIVLLPNLNELFHKIGGRLLPLGWARLIWGLFVRYPTTGRVPLMGVRKAYQQSSLGSGLAFALIDRLQESTIKTPIRGVELGWILEDNDGMRSILEAMGSVAYKRYRILERELAPR